MNPAARVLAERAPEPIRVGVILGSGLGATADAVADPVVVPYTELPGFPAPTVAGHAGRGGARAHRGRRRRGAPGPGPSLRGR